jgi:ureidoacrylate peracid hydrolase
MHNTIISPAAIAMSHRMRGDVTPLPIVPAKTAHVIVDLQVGFMAPGAVAEMPMNLQILSNVNKICAATRAAGGVNIFLRYTYDPGWTGFFGRFAPDGLEPFKAAFTAGAEQHALWPDLDVAPEDLILDKTRFSAMIPGTCDLDDVLKRLGVDTLIVTGCVSNCCCESTIRDAMQMNYNIAFVQDGNAAASDDDHNGAVADLFALFGCDICTTDSIVERLQAASVGQAA